MASAFLAEQTDKTLIAQTGKLVEMTCKICVNFFKIFEFDTLGSLCT